MELQFFINGIIALAIVFLLILLSWVWPPDSPWAPWWRTSKTKARIMCKLARVSKKDVVYDLGCGDGSAILVANKEFGAKAVGIEIDFTRVLVAKIRVFLERAKGVRVMRDNFHNQDLRKATVVFIYLVPRVIKALAPKFLQELKPGTRIICYVYKMDLPLIKKNTQEKIFVYTIPKRK